MSNIKEKANIKVPVGAVQGQVWKRSNLLQLVPDILAEEIPVALVYNGISHVIMMVTPKDLAAFAIGFSLSEGIITSLKDISAIDTVNSSYGTEVQIELSSRCFMALKIRRRSMAGRTGCGICGIEQLKEIRKPLIPLPFTQTCYFSILDNAVDKLRSFQPVGSVTGCTHAAVWIAADGKLTKGCEDIGRHVALDKLLGYRCQNNWEKGCVLISSRASYEMVQKAVMCGVEILFALSAATKLAVEVAEQSNLTLIGFCNPGRATIYTHPQRIMPPEHELELSSGQSFDG